MKLSEIMTIEMTMKVGSYEQLDKFLPEFEKLLVDGSHVGDIEELRVFSRTRSPNVDYAIFNDDDKIIGFFMMVRSTLDVIYIIPDFLGEDLLAKILFFLKRNEDFSKIIIGDRQSEATIKKAVKKVYARFDRAVWVNDETKEEEPYNPENLEKYYSLKRPTGWKLVLENSFDFSDWPKFYDRKIPDTRTIYEAFIT